MSSLSDRTRDRVRRILEDRLASVASFDAASSIVHHMREASHGASEAAQAHGASHSLFSGVATLESAAEGRSTPVWLADTLRETATQSMASTQEAHAIAEAAYDVLGSGTHRIPPGSERGRSLLRQAAIRGLGRTAGFEARVFLALSTLPHPGWLHAVCEAVGTLATGGCIWIVGVVGSYILGVNGSDRAVKLGVPTVVIVAFIAEQPAKVFFGSRRSFAHLLRMMVLGKKPRNRTFPSGHAATSFAGAWVLGSVWPSRRPVFLGLAAFVSLSRVYLGAHDPGEILAGTALGIGLAESLRRRLEPWSAQYDLPNPPRKKPTLGGGQRRVRR